MEREKKNPFVTKIDLDGVEGRLNVKIDRVDRKHDEKSSELLKLITVSEKIGEHIKESNERLGSSFDNLSKDIKEELKLSRKSYEKLSEKVNDHDRNISEHNRYIKAQQEIVDHKKKSLLKWVGALSAIFVAIIAGIFGVVEVLIPILFGGR